MSEAPFSTRSAYLQDLRIVVNARSPWLLRDFLTRWADVLGPLTGVLSTKRDEELRALLDEVAQALEGRSSHQLASQLIAPWFMPRSRPHPEE